MTDPSRQRTDKFPSAAVLLVAALPMLLVAMRVIQAGINLPFFDQWFPGSSVDVALASHGGTLRPGALWQPIFEHRIVFTNLTTALLARFGHWNVKAEMLISVALAGMASFVILSRLQALSARPLPIWLGALLSALMFGLRQQNNWLWSFATSWYFALLFVTLTLALLSRPGGGAGKLVLAAASAEAASLSLGPGLLAWPLGFALLLARTPRRMAPLLGWAAASGLGLLVQFNGQRIKLGASSGPLLPWALERIRFVLAFLGAPLLPDRPSLVGPATAVGAVALLTLLGMVFALRRAGFSAQRLSFVLGLAAYAVGSAALVALSSRGTPSTNALFGRYTANGTLIHVAVVALAWLLLEAGRSRLRLLARLLVAGVPLTTAVLFLATSILSWPPPPFLAKPEHLACVDDYVREGRSECFDGLYPVQFTNTVRLPELAAAGLTAFAGKPPRQLRSIPGWSGLQGETERLYRAGVLPATPNDITWLRGPCTSGNVERVEWIGETRVRATGWAYLTDFGRPAEAVLVTRKRAGSLVPIAATISAIPRGDVAAQFGANAVVTGWSVEFELPRSHDPLEFWVLDAGRRIAHPSCALTGSYEPTAK